MIFTHSIQRAIRFSIKTHEVYQKQKRKGKDIPYITHPLSVGLILARAGANEQVIIAGILHDTIEDSIPEKKVSPEMLEKRFGKEVAGLVVSVSEMRKDLPWKVRKRDALDKIKSYSHDALLVKSADILSNASELASDYEREGEEVFSRFNAPKEQIIQQHVRTITAIVERWSDNPLVEDLHTVARQLQSIGALQFMVKRPAKIIEYADYSENVPLQCPVCGWKGTPKESGWIEYYDDLLDVSCPSCEKMLLVVSFISS